MKNYLTLLLVLISLVSLISCNRDKAGLKEWSSTQSNNLSDEMFKDLWRSTEISWDEEESSSQFGSSRTSWLGNGIAINLSFDGNGGGTIDVDFDNGGNGVIGADLRRRKGQINCVFSGAYREAGSVITLTTSNYSLDGYIMSGTKTMTNNGYNSDGNLEFTQQVVNGYITTPDGEGTSWNTTRTHEWIEGGDTRWDVLDDEYRITGTASGISTTGISYTMDIETPLIYDVDCRYHINSGILNVKPDGYQERSIDFGNGTCDGQVTISVGRHSAEISLR